MDFNAGEVILLLVLAIVIFGPRSCPSWPARPPGSCTGSATSPTTPRAGCARNSVPEFSDLQLSDLNPKAFVAKHLGPDATDELNSVADEVRGVRTSLDGAIAASPAVDEDEDLTVAASVERAPTPFDPEAT